VKNWTLKGCLEVLHALSLIAGIIGLFFIGYQVKIQSEALQLQTKTLQDSQKINSANFVLKIGDQLNDPRYEKIMSAIEDHGANYKLLNGKFKERLLDDYIGIFETLGNLVQEKVITDEMAYNELGYELEKAWCNQDIQKYISDSRKVDKNISGSNVFLLDLKIWPNTAFPETKKPVRIWMENKHVDFYLRDKAYFLIRLSPFVWTDLYRDFSVKPLKEIEQFIRGEAAKMAVH